MACFRICKLALGPALLLGLALPGCSKRVATYPTTGSVWFEDDHPVESGFVEFRSGQTGLSARAKLNSDGTFKLGTFTEGDGAPAGEYQVVIVQFFAATPRNHKHTDAEPSDEKGVHDKEQAHDDGHGHEGHHHRDHDARVASLYASYSTTPLQA
ncbi:MAG: hypothetical protein IT425_14875, partial [Pirellulales bacterium]|nr:hypothetical protein [Pirellulales bacterium]